MRKMLLLAAMMGLAALMMAASPAMAQDNDRHDRNDSDRVFFVDDDDFFVRDFDRDFDQDFDQEAESGDVTLDIFIANQGDNSNFCTPVAQFGNTGNVQNAQGGAQFFSFADDFDFSAEDQLVFEPSLDTTCEQSVQQSSAASSDSWWW